jgi:D-alanyl-D-alanine carboxypeptidase (penicillin-binding protein 5/6)
VTKGQQIAKLRVMRGQTLALETPLRAAEDVDVGTLPQRALDAALELASGLFRKYVLKK